jgi:hypothetical protein
MKICIHTQYKENYGTAEDPYWKMKGGEEYIVEVPGFNYDHEMAFKKGQMIVDELRPKIEYSGAMAEEYINGWGFVPDDFMTDFERDQLKWDGEVRYPAKRFTYDELMASNDGQGHCVYMGALTNG